MRKSALTGIIAVVLIFSICFAAYAGEGVYYTVKPGDTLYGIGKKFGINYGSIIKNNSLASNTIVPGWKLSIPAGKYSVHMVEPGETLYGISHGYGVTVKEIVTASGLSNTIIYPGMKLMIPNGSISGKPDKVKPVFGGRTSLNGEEIRLLARLIHAEARGESVKGQIAVGAVIMNRLTSGSFPETIKGIIFQKNRGVYQFTPVQDGQINLEPDGTSFYAAEQAFNGEDPSGGALFFYNPETSSDRWIRTLPVTKVIGNHVFAK